MENNSSKGFFAELFPKREKSGNNKMSKKRKILIAAVAAVTLLIVVPVCVVYGYYSSKITMMQFDDGTLAVEGTISDSEVQEDAEAMEKATADLEEMEAVEAQGEVYTDEDVFNILLIGTDERSKKLSTNARGDSCMLLSVNKKTMEVHLVSFERGMGVPILDGQYKGQYDWLTHTFRYGGASLMMREIQECFKVDVDHYVRVNFHIFEQIIDSMGGVDIYITEKEAQGLNGEVKTNAKTDRKVHEGINHLSGHDALQYSRIRYIDNDWHRIERQRNVIEAVIDQTKHLSLPQLDKLLNEVLPLVQTNLTEADITNLLLLAPRYAEVSVEQMTIPAEGTYGGMKGMGGRSMFAANFDLNAKILHDALYGTNEAAETADTAESAENADTADTEQ